jgi:quercetin dioxygenase-like cupin family protein
MKVLHIDDVKGEKLGDTEAIRKVLVYSENLMLMYAEAMPDGPPLSHSHPNEQLGFVIQGTVELTASGETVILRAGSSYLLEPDEHHIMRCLGDEKVIILDTFHPHREDYLPKE